MADLLAGRRALITGAANGIGLATARRFRDEGAAVCLADVRADRLAQAAAELDAPQVVFDVTDEDEVEHGFEPGVRGARRAGRAGGERGRAGGRARSPTRRWRTSGACWT